MRLGIISFYTLANLFHDIAWVYAHNIRKWSYEIKYIILSVYKIKGIIIFLFSLGYPPYLFGGFWHHILISFTFLLTVLINFHVTQNLNIVFKFVQINIFVFYI